MRPMINKSLASCSGIKGNTNMAFKIKIFVELLLRTRMHYKQPWWPIPPDLY